MSRSIARKNRNKFREIRKKHLNFVVMVFDSENGNTRVYPRMFNTTPNLDDIKFTKEMMRAFGQGNKGCYSVSSHIGEEASRIWEEGLKRAQEAEANGELFFPTIKPQDSSVMEHSLDMMCKVMGVSRENLMINAPVSFASSVKDSVNYAVQLGQPITEPQEPSDVDFLSPWSTRMNLAGIWSQPVDTSKLEGPNIEQVIAEDLVNKVKQQLIQNRRERILKVAETHGEDIQVDQYLLQDFIKVFRERSDMWNMDEVQVDTPEYITVMVAACRDPEFVNFIKANGFNSIQIGRYALNGLTPEKVVDTYYIYSTQNNIETDSFIPSFIDPIGVQLGESIKRFNDQKIVTTRLDWSLPEDK